MGSMRAENEDAREGERTLLIADRAGPAWRGEEMASPPQGGRGAAGLQTCELKRCAEGRNSPSCKSKVFNKRDSFYLKNIFLRGKGSN